MPDASGTAVRLALGLVGLAAVGCGRIGYGLLPESDTTSDAGSRPPDGRASDIVDATPDVEDGAEDSAPEAEAEAEAEAGPDARCTQTAAVDYCQSVPPLPAPPIIDGALDCGPTLVPVVPEDWRGAAPLPPFPPGNSAEVAAAWRPDGLYVFIAVTTPVAIPADPWQQDYFGAGVEIFVDSDGVFTASGQYSDPGTVQMIVTAPPYDPADAAATTCPVDASSDAPDGLADAAQDAVADAAEAGVVTSPTGQRAEIYVNEGARGPWLSSQFGTFSTPNGFVFEGFFVAADLGLSTWGLAAGDTIGFDLAIDVSFPSYCVTGLEGHRAGQYFLHVATTPADASAEAGPIGAPYQDTRSFCTPTLTTM
jgi:hypothetical protein